MKSHKKIEAEQFMKIIAASICKQGGREYNQDYVAHLVDGNKACFVVCDGLGSYVGSEVASKLCAAKIVESFGKAVSDGADSYDEGVALKLTESAHNYVTDFKKKNPDIPYSCTTVALVMTDLNKTVMSHIGDSRIYLIRKGTIKYQSKDHSLAQLAVDMGRITTREIRTHKDQNKLTRVLGSDYYAEPDVVLDDVKLEAGDGFVICTDGFWEYVFEEEMEAAFLTCKTPEEVIDKLEKLLIQRIPSYNDNYTALVAIVTE